MSDIHVLTDDGIGNFSVVFHFPVPNTNNPQGKSWRTLLIDSGLGGKTKLAEGSGEGQITPEEKAKILLGEIYERPLTTPLESAGDTIEKQRVALQSLYSRRMATTLASLMRRLKRFGHTESKA